MEKILDLIKKLQIKNGPLTGSFYLSSDMEYVNWYFTNLTLFFIMDDLNHKDLNEYIKPYINAYINNLNEDLTINDYKIEQDKIIKTKPDSNDSYASSFLFLVYQYYSITGDSLFILEIKNKLKEIAYNVLCKKIKDNGLISVFVNDENDTAYLMDNCENYFGLLKFSQLLDDLNDDDSEVNYYKSFATNLANSIVSELWNKESEYFFYSDEKNNNFDFYPFATSQLFPELFDISELSVFFDKCWENFESVDVRWFNCKNDFPWFLVGLVAKKRQNNNYKKMIKSDINVNELPIHELGFLLNLSK